MKIIGISGVARSGKDTLCNLISRYLSEKNIESQRIALADKLKDDLKDFLLEKFSINILSPTPEEKTLLRPILVSYGKVKRSLTKGKYWTSMLEDHLDTLKKEKVVAIIDDDEEDCCCQLTEGRRVVAEDGGLLGLKVNNMLKSTC